MKSKWTAHVQCSAVLLSVTAIWSCKTASHNSALADASSYPYCSKDVPDERHDGWGYDKDHSCRFPPLCPRGQMAADSNGWGWANGASCRVAPICKSTTSGDWGWEQGQSCQVPLSGGSQPQSAGSPASSQQPSGGNLVLFETTYYPVGTESYFKTVCGDAQEHGGIYFATTEQSPLWHGECDNNSWTECVDSDCLGKFDRMPDDVKRWTNGRREVKEPRCPIPCNQKFKVYSQDKRISVDAYLFDVCPSQHWNNRYKEVNEGHNPCAKGAVHLDLRKPLYLQLNGGQVSDNIHIWVDPVPEN